VKQLSSSNVLRNMWLAQVHAARDLPYMAPIILRLKPRLSEQVETFGTLPDLGILVNPKFVEQLVGRTGAVDGVQQALIQVIKHEALHVFLGYWERQLGRQALAWNVAHDLEIAQYVRPPQCLTPTTFGLQDRMLAEWYYPRLPKLFAVGKPCGNHAAGGVDSEQAQRERHDARVESAHEIVRGNAAGVDPGMRDEALRILGIGKRSGMIAAMQGALTARGVQDYAFGRPSRRQQAAAGVVLPAMVAHPLRALCVLDVSGSMEEHLAAATQAVLSVVRSVGARVDVAAWDTVLHVRQAVRSARDLAKLKYTGGGTDMAGAIAWACRQPCDCVFVVTDCETAWPPQRPSKRVLVVRVGGNSALVPPAWIPWTELA